MRRDDPYPLLIGLALVSGAASFVHYFKPPGLGQWALHIPALLPWAVMAAAAGCAVKSVLLLRRARQLEDTPRSLARSAAQGYVEMEGHAQPLPGPDIICPLTCQRCVWWSYTVWQRLKNGDSYNWEIIEQDTSDDLFQLLDPSGAVIVDPYRAQVQPSIDRSWRGNHRRPDRVPKKSVWFGWGEFRYREQQIQVGDVLCASGEFRTQAALADFNETRDVTELLRDWKKDRRALLARFDTNRNGEIEPEEWEAARQAAIAEVRGLMLKQATNPDISLLACPADGRAYLLSTLSQPQVARRLRHRSLLWLASALGLGAALDFFLHLIKS